MPHSSGPFAAHDAPGFPGANTTAPFNECPAIGYDASCGLLIVVSNNGDQVLQDSNNESGVAATPGQQMPYDQKSDTLVGIVNTSSKPLFAIQLSGSSTGTPIFGFDGDGVCTYSTNGSNTNGGSGGDSVPLAGPGGYTGDSYCTAAQKAGRASASGPDSNGSDYQGPTTTFSNISADARTGVVNFAGGLSPGQSTYFSLEAPNQVSIQFGYLMAASDGGIFAYDAPYFGSMGGHPLNQPIVGIAADPRTGGYWEVASDGGIFAFNAPFLGSMGGQPLNAPIVGMAATPDGGGYWEVASDGGIFSFGDAVFEGSMGGQPLNAPIVGMAATPEGGGYWEVASDGGLFAFNAPFFGSPASMPLNMPVVGMASTPDGRGYWETASDGGIFNYGDAIFWGSTGSITLNKPMVGIAGSNT